MRPRALGAIARAVGGELRGSASSTHPVATGASIDSRVTVPGDLFFAIRAERDGHGFIEAARAAGAVAAIVARESGAAAANEGARIVVDDPRRALADLARAVRSEEPDVPAIAVTGSVGKTTLCGTLSHLLAPLGTVHRPPSSFNNDLGVPLTILGAPGDTALLVIEIGTNGPGEIAMLTPWARASTGVVTAIAPVHLEGLGSLDGVRAEKFALLDGLVDDREGNAPTGWVPADEVGNVGERASRVRTFGAGGETRVELAGDGVLRWTHRGETHAFPAAAPPRQYFPAHRADAIAVALAIGTDLGIDSGAMVERIATVPEPPLRGEVRRVGEVELILDCYNASPVSVTAALERLESEPATGRRRCVLGTMEELGAEAPEYHRAIGRRIAAGPVDPVHVVGRGGGWIAEGLAEQGRSARPLDLDAAAARAFAETLAPGDRVLFKASRTARLEEFAARVTEFLGERSATGRNATEEAPA